MQWRDVRFSIRGLMIAIAALAVVLALVMALWPEHLVPDPPFDRDDLDQRL